MTQFVNQNKPIMGNKNILNFPKIQKEILNLIDLINLKELYKIQNSEYHSLTETDLLDYMKDSVTIFHRWHN